MYEVEWTDVGIRVKKSWTTTYDVLPNRKELLSDVKRNSGIGIADIDYDDACDDGVVSGEVVGRAGLLTMGSFVVRHKRTEKAAARKRG